MVHSNMKNPIPHENPNSRLLSGEIEMNSTLIPLVISIITLFLGLYFSENETQVAATAVIYSVWVATAYIVSVVENKNDQR